MNIKPKNIYKDSYKNWKAITFAWDSKDMTITFNPRNFAFGIGLTRKHFGIDFWPFSIGIGWEDWDAIFLQQADGYAELAWQKANEGEVHQLENTTEILTWVHPAKQCVGEACTIHNMSDHHMRSWPQHWRGDWGFIERICPHGVGHPDPDEPADVSRIHGCDGCCS